MLIGDSRRSKKEFTFDSRSMSVPSAGAGRSPIDPDAKFTARKGPRFELVKEEVEILQRVFAALGERTSIDAPEEEKRAAFEQLLEEDPEMAALWERLGELVAANDESVFLALGAMERDEEWGQEGEP